MTLAPLTVTPLAFVEKLSLEISISLASPGQVVVIFLPLKDPK